eukprot:gene10354-biopygen12941
MNYSLQSLTLTVPIFRIGKTKEYVTTYNVKIQRKYKVIEVKGKWAGHVARMKNHEWAKKTTEWTPWDRKRGKGRPKRRWRDEIEQKAGSTWTQSAQNRDEWRKMWRPPASSGVTG